MENRLTIVESPFATDRECVYLKRCLRDSWDRKELPFASHGFFPLFLDEDDPQERNLGIKAGYAFYGWAERVAFYIDYEMSPGMVVARMYLTGYHPNLPIEERRIGPNPSR